MITVELANRSGSPVDEVAVIVLCRETLEAEGIGDGDLGVAFVPPAEMRALKREHLGVDELTDVLSFPIDGREEIPDGLPRQLGDVVICPAIVGTAWQWPLVHGLLHLLGYEHGDEMVRREEVLTS